MILQSYNNCQVIGVQLILLILFATNTVQLLLPLFELLLSRKCVILAANHVHTEFDSEEFTLDTRKEKEIDIAKIEL